MSAKEDLARLNDLLYAPTMPQLASVVAGMNELLSELPSWDRRSLQEKFAIAAAATVSAHEVAKR